MRLEVGDHGGGDRHLSEGERVSNVHHALRAGGRPLGGQHRGPHDVPVGGQDHGQADALGDRRGDRVHVRRPEGDLVHHPFGDEVGGPHPDRVAVGLVGQVEHGNPPDRGAAGDVRGQVPAGDVRIHAVPADILADLLDDEHIDIAVRLKVIAQNRAKKRKLRDLPSSTKLRDAIHRHRNRSMQRLDFRNRHNQ